MAICSSDSALPRYVPLIPTNNGAGPCSALLINRSTSPAGPRTVPPPPPRASVTTSTMCARVCSMVQLSSTMRALLSLCSDGCSPAKNPPTAAPRGASTIPYALPSTSPAALSNSANASACVCGLMRPAAPATSSCTCCTSAASRCSASASRCRAAPPAGSSASTARAAGSAKCALLKVPSVSTFAYEPAAWTLCMYTSLAPFSAMAATS